MIQVHRRSTWGRIASGAVLAAGVCLASAAQAAATPEEMATARALFDKGRELVAAGNAAEACPKFEESQRLDPGVGTLYNLADCYEKIGKTASAWSLFLEAASQSAASGQTPREKAARERADQLRPTLSTLTIVPGDAALPGLEIKHDGKVVGRGQWSTPTPVDPGKHTIEAWAPGKVRFSVTVEVAAGAKAESVSIPTLQDVPAVGPIVTPSAATPTADRSPARTWQRPTAYVAGGIGIVSLGLATVFALRAKSKLNDSSAWCYENLCHDQRGMQLQKDAGSQADLATVFTSVGAVMLVAGGVLFFTAPRTSDTPSTSRTTTPSVAVGPGSLLIKGEW